MIDPVVDASPAPPAGYHWEIRYPNPGDPARAALMRAKKDMFPGWAKSIGFEVIAIVEFWGPSEEEHERFRWILFARGVRKLSQQGRAPNLKIGQTLVLEALLAQDVERMLVEGARL